MKQTITIRFPIGGINRRHAYQSQAPYTCFDCLNVIADSQINERERGGSRPGTSVAVAGNVGGAVELLSSLGYVDNDNKLRHVLLAGGGGNLFFQDEDGLASVGGGLATDGTMTGVEFNNKFYVAGGDDDDRTPYVFSPNEEDDAERWKALTATVGTLPTKCKIISRYSHRLILAGDEDQPNNIYASAIGSPQDWDTGADSPGSAVDFDNSNAGTVGEPVTALVEHTDTCMIIGCRSSIWVIRSDPGFGGKVTPLNMQIGILSETAWCYSADDYLWVLTQEGLAYMPPGCGSPFTSVSREKLPQELRGIDPDKFRISLAYDIGLRSLIVSVTERTPSGTGFNDQRQADFIDPNKPEVPEINVPPGSKLKTSHFIVDIRNTLSGDYTTRSSCNFFPITFEGSREPFSIQHLRDSEGAVGYAVMGTRNGILRRFDTSLEADDDAEFQNYVVIGPILLSQDGKEGMLHGIGATMAQGSGDVEFEVFVARTAEEALLRQAPNYKDKWVNGGTQRVKMFRARGNVCYIVVRGTGQKWSMESIQLIREGSKQPLLGWTLTNQSEDDNISPVP